MTTDCDFTGDIDYISGPYSITIPAGETQVKFNVSLIDDDISEVNKNFELVIMSRSLIADLIRGRSNRLRVTIMDDDNG